MFKSWQKQSLWVVQLCFVWPVYVNFYPIQPFFMHSYHVLKFSDSYI